MSAQSNTWQAPTICWQAHEPHEPETDSLRRCAALNLPDCQSASDKHISDDDTWVLGADAQGLFLKTSNDLILRSDFGRDNATVRTAQSGFIHDTFSKAIGIPRLKKSLSRLPRLPRIVDATGGLGQDAMTLVSLGCDVTVIERHPILHCLLADMMTGEPNASVVNDDANDALRDTATAFKADVIYLDPMYPQQKRRGKSKKGMQVLHELLGPDVNNDSLLPAALDACEACDGFRVVVKRPKGATPLVGHDGWQGQKTCIESPNTRYDIYHHRPLG